MVEYYFIGIITLQMNVCRNVIILPATVFYILIFGAVGVCVYLIGKIRRENKS